MFLATRVTVETSGRLKSKKSRGPLIKKKKKKEEYSPTSLLLFPLPAARHQPTTHCMHYQCTTNVWVSSPPLVLAVSYRPATRLTVPPQRSLRCFTTHCTQLVLHIPDNVHTLHRSPLSASKVKPVPSATTPLPPHPSASTVKPAAPSATTPLPLPPLPPPLPPTAADYNAIDSAGKRQPREVKNSIMNIPGAVHGFRSSLNRTATHCDVMDCDVIRLYVTNLAPHRCGTVLTGPDLLDVGFTFRQWNGWFGSGCGPVLPTSSERRKGLILS